MKTRSRFRLGDLQLKILRILWEKGSACVGDVHSALGKERYAYTTIATMLRKMEARGLVSHRLEHRRFVYSPLVSESQVVHSAASDFVDRLFSGSLAAAVCHLLDSCHVTEEELEELERLIGQRKQNLQDVTSQDKVETSQE